MSRPWRLFLGGSKCDCSGYGAICRETTVTMYQALVGGHRPMSFDCSPVGVMLQAVEAVLKSTALQCDGRPATQAHPVPALRVNVRWWSCLLEYLGILHKITRNGNDLLVVGSKHTLHYVQQTSPQGSLWMIMYQIW